VGNVEVLVERMIWRLTDALKFPPEPLTPNPKPTTLN